MWLALPIVMNYPYRVAKGMFKPLQIDHEAIIAAEEFESAQEEMARRKELGRAYSDKAFHSKIIYGNCGGFYGRKVWHSTEQNCDKSF